MHMWKAKHQTWCKDSTLYRVVWTTQEIHKVEGGTVDIVDDGDDDADVHAQCVACGAKAEWKPARVI